ncbi:oligosaccharide flippase family protein [Cryobacterium tepidiphilum]|uniref:Flippase n=1 Tax=Cryobacterium tepidiphilum TaxID=2486026 RepID=A0A3M8LR61_9MICO|nr:polysaccharide biosynthesis C-terminal domain-containing protein [Cryobacterium tepidiphilum]RNE67369.1 flippase [Cryobacterium tepidiphilum]
MSTTVRTEAAGPAAVKPPENLMKGGITSFLGAATSALMGFILTVVLARTLGDSGAGVILQAIAIFTIVLSFARAGMDSAAVWIMPRLADHDTGQIRSALAVMFTATAGAGIVCGIGTLLLSPLLAGSGDPHAGDVRQAVAVVAWFIPVGALLLVALSATRGLGGVLPYVTVGSVALPALRPVVVGLLALGGGSLTVIALGWAAPLPLALAAAVLVLVRQVRRHERAGDARGSFFAPSRTLRKTIWAYSAPRVVSAGLEQSVIWLDVLLVGIISGSAAAGVYGGASRFVAAGLIVNTAIRVVVAPAFSRLLAQEKKAETGALYRTAATWLVLFGTPIYVILALFSPVVLGLLGPEFVRGGTALSILCVGAVLTFTAGTIQSLLLMSGRSGWDAVNKSVVLFVNVAGNLLLIPLMGITGAAVTWAFSMLVDAALAAIEVRKFLGISIELRSVLYALLVPVASVGLPAGIARLTLGPGLLPMTLSIVVGGIFLLTWCALDRERLHLHELVVLARRKRAPSPSLL